MVKPSPAPRAEYVCRGELDVTEQLMDSLSAISTYAYTDAE